MEAIAFYNFQCSASTYWYRYFISAFSFHSFGKSSRATAETETPNKNGSMVDAVIFGFLRYHQKHHTRSHICYSSASVSSSMVYSLHDTTLGPLIISFDSVLFTHTSTVQQQYQMRTLFLILRFTHQSFSLLRPVPCIAVDLHISLHIRVACSKHIFLLASASFFFHQSVPFLALSGVAHNFSSSQTVVRGACVLLHFMRSDGSHRTEEVCLRQKDSVKWIPSRDKPQADT